MTDSNSANTDDTECYVQCAEEQYRALNAHWYKTVTIPAVLAVLKHLDEYILAKDFDRDSQGTGL